MAAALLHQQFGAAAANGSAWPCASMMLCVSHLSLARQMRYRAGPSRGSITMKGAFTALSPSNLMPRARVLTI